MDVLNIIELGINQLSFLPGMTGGFTLVGDSGQAAALSHKVN